MRPRHLRAGAALLCLTALTTLVSCGSSDEAGDGRTTVDYWLWDDLQLPAYQECATAFEKANPDIAVRITQTAWNQYWQNLTTQLVSGEAPDVWTNQATYYPQFAAGNQLLDLQPYVERDGLDVSAYQAGLADTWVKDDKRYGLPKDWDTMAVVYNTDMLKRQGVDLAALNDLTWNPADGGTLEQVIARATVDSEGRNGLDPAFDKDHVEVYGFLPEWADGAQGQNGWGNFAAANGFEYLDKNPWGTHYKFDDARLAETVSWFRHLIDKGYAPRLDQQSSVARTELLIAGKGAMSLAGSFTVSSFTGPKVKQDFGFAAMPVGPAGRKSALNGLADSVWAGTDHKEEAWKWVKYLASADCQDRVAAHGVVFPALKSSTEKALAAHEADGDDVRAFTDAVGTKGVTFQLPVTEHGTEISPLVQDAIQSAILGQEDAADALESVNGKVNGLFD
ncbi:MULTISPECIES: sugar ABC transporter substrate-binding protein [Streptomyces]|uniref:Substrate binding protein n=4 Tax=Streptomyces TaxID=1883 RepID=A0ABM5RCU2_STRLI|nr:MULTISPECIES: sugar ABC transporter substrate-binding protein [Streptomyces]QSJ13805.1 substrate binding protein [Streptomyces lividans]AIJ18185.1 substrate binding protein [Streptomyces lividans TK24]EFD71684.1 substrate binding protein [Streptomyces lividans TK24]EOY44944.1 putative substrate binding protein [Streptomyces lividans 1326]KKD17484.1 sugar-binding protein [Streptomyces sp. WM6391]